MSTDDLDGKDWISTRSMKKRIFYTRKDFCFGKCEVLEQEISDKNGILIIKCIDCHFDEIISYNCLDKTATGKRCRQEGRYGGYCRYHKDNSYAEALEEFKRYEIAEIRYTYNLTRAKLHDYYYHGYRERKNPKKSYVYFIESKGYVKIGYSINPKKRLLSLQSDNDHTIIPDEVEIKNAKLIGQIFGGQKVEALLHSIFHQYRVEGEWFRFNKALRSEIDKILQAGDKDILQLMEDIDTVEVPSAG